jgi:transposase
VPAERRSKASTAAQRRRERAQPRAVRTQAGRWIDWDEAVALLREGATLGAIAEHFGASRHTISRGLAARGERRERLVLRGSRDIKLHDAWLYARGKCHNESHETYSRFGARGIRMCPEWRRSFNAFREWALANGYRPGLVLAQKRRDRDLDPENCEWVTRVEAAARRPRPDPAKRGKRKRPATIDWDLAILLLRSDISIPAIAKHFGARGQTITEGLRRRGVKRERDGLYSTLAGRRLKQTWHSLHARCSRPSDPHYPAYGAKGARVGREWKTFEPFYEWALESGWKPGLCLVRIGRRKVYAPGNCEWITKAELRRRMRPARERSPRSAITAFGETKGLMAWVRDPRSSVGAAALRRRLRSGMDPERAISLPPQAAGPQGARAPVRAFGETRSAAAWARDPRCGISEVALRKRLASGMRPEEAITLPPQMHTKGGVQERLLTALGTSKSLFEWEQDRRCAVTASSIKGRLLRGWSPDDAIRTPPREQPLSERLPRRRSRGKGAPRRDA